MLALKCGMYMYTFNFVRATVHVKAHCKQKCIIINVVANSIFLKSVQ